MVPVPKLNEGDLDLLVAYAVASDEEMGTAIVNAFLAANIDVFEKSTVLGDWINPDIFEDGDWSPRRPTYHSTQIWNHQVVITPEEIRIYSSSALS